MAFKPVTRRTKATVRELGQEREILVTIEESGLITFKPAGLRRAETLTADVCFHAAVKARLAQEKKDKKRGK